MVVVDVVTLAAVVAERAAKVSEVTVDVDLRPAEKKMVSLISALTKLPKD